MSKAGRLPVFAIAAVLLFAFAGAAHACPACYGEAQGPLIDAARLGAWMLISVVAFMWVGFLWFFIYLWRRAKRFRQDPPLGDFGAEPTPCECCT